MIARPITATTLLKTCGEYILAAERIKTRLHLLKRSECRRSAHWVPTQCEVFHGGTLLGG